MAVSDSEGSDEESDDDELDGKLHCSTLLCGAETSNKECSCKLTVNMVSSSSGKYGLRSHEEKVAARRLQKQLKTWWKLEQIIQEQLNWLNNAHYSCAMVPTRLKEVAEFLMPKWTTPHELAALSWLGVWRPSAILSLLRGLANFPSTLWASCLRDSYVTDRHLSQVINEISIEEAVIEAEMAEIQATCVLFLPFSPLNKLLSHNAALSCLQTEFKKIQRVIIKAQKLRFKTMELLVKKVLVRRNIMQL